jgi:arginyl-tRNA synthetase
MHDLQLLLQQAAAQGLNQLYDLRLLPADISIQRTAADKKGDFTILLFPLTKYKIGTPETVGQQLGVFITQQLAPSVAEYEVIKGFLNIRFSDAAWIGWLNQRSNELLNNQTDWLVQHWGNRQKVMVEFSSPNTNKPLHLGHLRNNFLGDAIANILQNVGYEVIRANLINDRGVHICKSMHAWQLVGNNETPESANIKGDHLVGKYYVAFDKICKEQLAVVLADWQRDRFGDMPPELIAQARRLLTEQHQLQTALAAPTANKKEEKLLFDKLKKVQDEIKELAQNQTPVMKSVQQMLRQWEAGDTEVRALWQKMNDWVLQGLQQTYQRTGIRFDKIYYESQTYLLGKEIIDEGLKKGIFYQKPDKSVWIDLTAEGLNQKLLLRSDGTSVYITQDLGTADLKYKDYQIEKSIYVIGNEQEHHMKLLIAILKKLGRPYAEGVYHLSYGMVELPGGKMKSREGTVVDADDLIDEMIATATELTNELGRTEGLTAPDLDQLYETLAMGALKYYLLRVDPVKTMVFDPQESIDFKGHTGTFIQHAYARTSSLLRKAKATGFNITNLPADLQLPLTQLVLEPIERELILQLYAYPERLADAAKRYNPALLANYLYELAKNYNRFYYELPVIKTTVATITYMRLIINYVVGKVIQVGMQLLGIRVPEQM